MLKLARGLSLPVDVAGEAIAILAKRGAGKTNTATVLVEELYAAGVQVVILDPVGAWWGIRSSADGTRAGLHVPILGGQHGDVPLEPTAGALIADVAVDSGSSLLLDLSDFPSKASTARFVVDFGERLFRRKARASSLLHLVLEEADSFAPQKVRGEDARMAGAVEQIVRRGRSRGIGITMVTQRSAVLNKDVLSQADVLIAMRTTSPHDVAAIKLWIAVHADDEHGVVDSLPSLKTGEAWVWNPERGLLQRVQVRRRRTFDSSATPKAGERRVEPERTAAIDLEQLGEQIAETAEQAKANDPAELRRRIRALEQQLADRPATVEERVVEKVVELPVVSDQQIAELRATVEKLGVVARNLDGFTAMLTDVAGDLIVQLARVSEARPRVERASSAAVADTASTVEHAGPRAAASASAVGPETVGERQGRRPAPPAAAALNGNGPDVPLKPGARRMLATLAAFHPRRLDRGQLSVLAAVTKGGTFSSYLSALRTAGLIDEDGDVLGLSAAGLAAVPTPPAPPSPQELRAMYERAMKPGAQRMFAVLWREHPNALTRDALAQEADVTKGGTFSSYLSRLRTLGLLDEQAGRVRLSDTLFLGGHAA